MRITLLTNDYPPEARGGAGVIAQNQAEYLRSRGYHVDVVHEPMWFQDRSIPVRFVAHLLDLFARKEIVRRVVETKPDVLITHTLAGCGFGTSRRVKVKRNVRWIHVVHDVQLVEPSGQIVFGESFSFLRNVWRWMWSTLRRAALGSPDVVVSPSNWLMDFHVSRGFFRGSKKKVIPNPIPQFSTNDTNGEKRISNEDILYVGRLDRDKGILDLLSAWELLGDERPNLHIVGSGSEEKTIEQKKDSKLFLHGRVQHAELARFYREQPTVIIPSRVFENQPTVILEALSYRCPVIATEVGGIPELLREGGGELVPPGDDEALANAIQNRRSIPAASEEKLKRHSPEVVFSELESVLKSNL